MTVAELIAILQKLPQLSRVEVNDNLGGCIHYVDQVDDFPNDEDGTVVMLQVNCD